MLVYLKTQLIVLKDLDELKIMSTKPEGNKKYPSHYFVIYKDQGFDYEKHLYGTENPNIVFIRAQKGPKRPDYKCYKVSRDGLFVKKRIFREKKKKVRAPSFPSNPSFFIHV